MHQEQQSFTEGNGENVIDTSTSTDDETEFSTAPLPSFSRPRVTVTDNKS